MTKEEKRQYDQDRYRKIRATPALLERRKVQVRNATMDYYWRNRESKILKTKTWAQRNPEKHLAAKRRWYWKHRDERVEKARQRYSENVERNRSACRDWYAAHREYAKAMTRAWQKKNRDRLTHYANKRRVLKIENGGSHSLDDWRFLCERFEHTCFYCRQRGLRLTRDHLTPVSRGGTDDIENIVPSCKPCNSSKGTSTLEEFMDRLESRGACA